MHGCLPNMNLLLSACAKTMQELVVQHFPSLPAYNIKEPWVKRRLKLLGLRPFVSIAMCNRIPGKWLTTVPCITPSEKSFWVTDFVNSVLHVVFCFLLFYIFVLFMSTLAFIMKLWTLDLEGGQVHFWTVLQNGWTKWNQFVKWRCGFKHPRIWLCTVSSLCCGRTWLNYIQYF